ncbi:MAG: His/Gly/Thr/Pro-type tRNA ligase C-terminal domain-containing protein [Candidatus Nanopelagicales bacterium]
MPIIVVYGKKLVEGLVEVKDRASGETKTVAKEELLLELVNLVTKQLQETL